MSTQTNIKVFQRLLFLVPILYTIVGNIGKVGLIHELCLMNDFKTTLKLKIQTLSESFLRVLLKIKQVRANFCQRWVTLSYFDPILQIVID